MPNRFFVIFLLLVSVSFAQVSQKANVKNFMPLRFDENAPVSYDKAVTHSVPSVLRVMDPSVGDTVGYTSYDYFANSLIRDQVVYYGGKIHISPMVRKWGSSKRVVSYITNSSGTYQTYAAFDSTTGNSGYQQIDIQRTGTNPGTIGIVAHHTVSGGALWNQLSLWDGTSSFVTSNISLYTDPSLQFVGDSIFAATSGNRTLYEFLLSPDYGVTFPSFTTISAYVPPIYYKYNGSTELGIAKSIDEKYIAFYGASRNSTSGGTAAYSCASADTADDVFLILSNNRGKTFTGYKVGTSGVIGEVVNRPKYAPLLANFGQFDVAISAGDGVAHGVYNGYSAVFNATNDTILADAFPLLYWNSKTKQFKAISNEAIDTLSDIANITRPGNNLGACYPSVAVSDDGKGVFAVWTGPQITNGKVDSLGGFYLTDVYYAYSVDGGTTWKNGVLAGNKTVSEQYGTCAQFLEDKGTFWRAHLYYLVDLVPGTSVFSGGGAISNNPLVYRTFDFLKTTGIKDAGVVAKSFSLEQNYPNPFNPTTTIRFSLAEKSNVSLKVYDMLGREVASLLNNQELGAGSQNVTFDASKLASGIYVYTLKAGNYTESKKLTLMK